MKDSLRVALVGWGAINQEVVRMLRLRCSPISIVAVAVRTPSRTRLDLPPGASTLTKADQLSDVSPDFVVEAAGREAVKEWGSAALRCSRAFAPASVSAFSDDACLATLIEIAKEHHSQILIPAGAIGIDALAAASILPMNEVLHTIVKPPSAWRGTSAEQMADLDQLSEPTVFFSGTAREAASCFPQNANVAITSALAGVGLDRTKVVLMADPEATANEHRISAGGNFGRLQLSFENRSLRENPKSSQLTALSLVRLIENQVMPLVV